MEKIVNIQMSRVSQRFESKNISFDIKPKALKHVLQAGYDPIYGARPMRRYLEKTIVTQLSKLILSGDLQDNSTVEIDESDGALNYKIVAKPLAATTPKRRRLSKENNN